MQLRQALLIHSLCPHLSTTMNKAVRNILVHMPELAWKPFWGVAQEGAA